MKIRLGYVAIALNLPKVTSSGSVTYTNYENQGVRKKIEKIKTVWLFQI